MMKYCWLRSLRFRAAAPSALFIKAGPPLVQSLYHGHVRCLSNEDSSKRREKLPVELREEDLEEQFVKGWGKGGQKINKVRNCVLLKHIPTGLHIRCQETRSLDGNRRTARKLLIQKLDDQLNGELSKRNVKIDKLRKKKASKRNKSKQKYAAHKAGKEEDGGSEDDDVEEDEEEDGYGSDGDVYDDEEEDPETVEIDMDGHKFRSKTKQNRD